MSYACNILSLYYIRKYVTDTQNIPKNIKFSFIYFWWENVFLLLIESIHIVLYSNNKDDNESEIYFTISIRYEDVDDDDDKLILQDESNLPRPWTHAASNKAKRPIVRYCHMTISVYPDPSPSLYILPPTSPHIPS